MMTKQIHRRPSIVGFAVLAAFLLSLTACGTFSKVKSQTPISDVLKDVPEKGYKPDSHYKPLSLETNPQVDMWIRYFTGRGRRYMHLYLERSARYMPLMKATFRERGMPDQLAYVAMIESGLNSNAFSRASAVGYWQFIRETGRRYNLRIDPYVDERRDPILSTEAAATFLDSLYSVFGDWYLALAAYNAGEQRIMNAVMRHRTRDFWQLASRRRVLPVETRNYIPKFIAAVLIAENPKKYGFTDINLQPAFTFDSVVIDKPISLETLAQQLHVDYDDLKLMNPRYKSDYVPVYSDRINAIRVPTGMKALAMAAIPSALSNGPKHYIASFEYYRIRRGDNLIHIAHRFHTSIARLRDLNDLSSHAMIRAGRRLKVPEVFLGRGPVRSVASASRSQVVTVGRYRVRPGDNLISIAMRFHTSVAHLRSLNHLTSHSMIRAGRLLKVASVGATSARHVTSASRKQFHRRVIAKRRIIAKQRASSKHRVLANRVAKRQAVAASKAGKIHIVRRGENLSTIARRYRVTVSDIAHANSLHRHSKLLAGTELIIPD